MRRILTLLALCLFALPAQARELPTAKLYAVYFYADWCGNCKVLSPIMGEVRSDPAIQKAPVLFVTFDLTDKPRIAQAKLLASALGLGDFLVAQGSATGYVALLDAKTKKEVAHFDSGADAASIRQTILTQLGD